MLHKNSEIDIGIFSKRLTNAYYPGRPCLFLDRDGVVVEETGYLHRQEDIAIIPGVAEAVARANRLGSAVVMVTNQSGIGRGYYTWAAFSAVQDAIFAHVAREAGALFDLALACAYHANGIGAYAVANHPWRKPNPGMLLETACVLGIDLSRSFIVGDTLTDLAAGHAAGLAGGALVRTGHGEREWLEKGEARFADWIGEKNFSPRRADNAASAIHRWLDETTMQSSL